ncbi:hypothetical protein K3728_16530 [Rhodobacteraceae bacterium M385]|nr:hypothetical protein K3728_16530 [Rhodobacteraceae bacterium M385]
MRGPTALVLALAGFAPAGAAHADFIPDFFQSTEELFCQVCEAQMVERLRSPSSYERLECEHFDLEPMDEAAYATWRGVESFDALEETDRRIFSYGTSYVASIFLSYEAANGFGAQIRGVAQCQARVTDESAARDVRPYAMRVNGETNIDWMTGRVLDRLE